MKQVAGVNLADLRAPIGEALAEYEGLTEYRLAFDSEKAAVLEPTPDKPNSARSQTTVKYLGQAAGDLFVIAFQPGDGTGAESEDYQLEDLVAQRPYRRNAKSVPRSKAGVHSEAHMTIATRRIDDIHADPIKFGGTFDLLGLSGRVIHKIGELGQDLSASADELAPLTTYTVGWRASTGEKLRFGDPHAVYSRLPGVLQVCAFLALKDDVRGQYPDMLSRLNPQMPRQA